VAKERSHRLTRLVRHTAVVLLGCSKQGAPVCQGMKTENAKGESTPPAITSFSPARSGASSVRK
jgi:hypothetical protein